MVRVERVWSTSATRDYRVFGAHRRSSTPPGRDRAVRGSGGHPVTGGHMDVEYRIEPIGDTICDYHEGNSVRSLRLSSRSVRMSRNRDERGQYTETVSLSEVLEVFDTVAGPAVTSGDIASATGCSRDTARRKLETLQEQ